LLKKVLEVQKKEASSKHTTAHTQKDGIVLERKKEFAVALVVVVLVYVLLALPYAMTEVYGLEVSKLILLARLVALTALSVALLIWWLARYRRTSHALERLRGKIQRDKPLWRRPRTPRIEEANQNKRGG